MTDSDYWRMLDCSVTMVPRLLVARAWAVTRYSGTRQVGSTGICRWQVPSAGWGPMSSMMNWLVTSFELVLVAARQAVKLVSSQRSVAPATGPPSSRSA